MQSYVVFSVSQTAESVLYSLSKGAKSMRENWNRKYSSSEYSKHRTSQA